MIELKRKNGESINTSKNVSKMWEYLKAESNSVEWCKMNSYIIAYQDGKQWRGLSPKFNDATKKARFKIDVLDEEDKHENVEIHKCVAPKIKIEPITNDEEDTNKIMEKLNELLSQI